MSRSTAAHLRRAVTLPALSPWNIHLLCPDVLPHPRSLHRSPAFPRAGLHRAAPHLIVCLAVALLTACAGSGSDKADSGQVEAYAKRGYVPEERLPIETLQATWTVSGQPVDVALTLPTRRDKLPLVIYLPGVGENRAAGRVWREAWASAGYAVLSVQPLAEDATPRTDRRGRDVAGSARPRYAPQAVTDRVALLAVLLKEAAQRRQQNEPPWGRIDTSRVAVAGYEIGAYTATVIAGETIKGTQPAALPAKVAAAIAFSPYADFSGVGLQSRYRGIRIPVLWVTGEFDTDRAAGVTAVSLRKAGYDFTPAGDKYFLLLSGAPHAVMSGHGPLTPEETAQAKAAAEAEARARKSGSDELAGDLDEELGTSKGKNRQPAPRLDVPFTATDAELRTATAQSISTAFLDAYLRNDSVALEWLQKDAARWTAKNGEFLQR